MKKSFKFVIVLVILLTIYQLLAIKMNNQLIFPHLSSIWTYIRGLDFAAVSQTIGKTFFRTVISFLFAVIVSLLLAVIAQNKYLNGFVSQTVSILRTMPTIAIIILILIWFKSQVATFIISFLVVFPLLYEGFVFGLAHVDQKLLEVSRVYRFTTWQNIKYIYFYQMIEQFLLQVKQSFGLAFKIMVMAEVIGQVHQGIGAEINRARMNIEMEGIIVWTAILIILVLLLEWILEMSSKKLLKWK